MVRFLSGVFPRRTEQPLYDLFAELAEVLVQAADTQSRLLGQAYRERTRLAPHLHELSTRSEELCRRIAERLAHSLITPYEAELLYDFALTIADAIDQMDHTAGLLVVSRAGALPAPLLDVAEGIERSAEHTVAATWKLSDVQTMGEYHGHVRRQKRQADRLVREALGELYRQGGSMQETMPLHDAAQSLHTTTVLLEKVARLTDAAGAAALLGKRGMEVLQRTDGTYVALFVDQWRAQVTARDNPELVLETLPAGGV